MLTFNIWLTDGCINVDKIVTCSMWRNKNYNIFEVKRCELITTVELISVFIHIFMYNGEVRGIKTSLPLKSDQSLLKEFSSVKNYLNKYSSKLKLLSPAANRNLYTFLYSIIANP